MAKKVFAVLFVVLTFLIGSVDISYAAESPWDPKTDTVTFDAYRDAIEADNCLTPSLECLVHQVFQFTAIEFVNSTLYTEFRPNFGNDDGSYDPNNPTPVASSPQTGILTGMGRIIGYMYAYPAANTQTYVADLMNSAHITPKAYAQGLGFSSLNPILSLWKSFRNIAYMFFVLIFIIIGFMIMFRQRISGQAAVTAQQAIPSVIISLIIVTFSYAIVGFMIDLMYLSMFLIVGVFAQTLPDGNQNLIDMNIRQIGGALFTAANVLQPDENIDLVTNLIASLVGETTLGTALGVIGGLTLSVVLAIAILIGTVKLFFELLKSYASIIISVITSPVVLMMGAIPGRNPVVPWLKNIFGNLLPFPTVLFVLVLYYQFIGAVNDTGNEGGFMPPFLLGTGQNKAIASLLGLALLLALPEIVKSVKKGLVTEGFGTMVFRAAAASAKEGWKGGELIPGTGIKVPGAQGPVAIGGGATFGTAGGALTGAAGNIFRRRVLRDSTKEGPGSEALTGASRGFFRTSKALGSKTITPETPKKLLTVVEKARKRT